ncbi:MAG TPA: nucleotidyl transferase AbiEii/AbiGii toxin family protein [Frankiaceae bacterium]|nr:nucleotidyl transferase AbiEii/AbiGii toxin family protein [Frankiaceae bacterium]
MLDPRELREVAERFGVAEDQVRRDHLVSHVLAAVSRLAPAAVFFGGTALARTHLPAGRLSEDVDLYAARRRDVARALTTGIPSALRREFPRLAWDPAPEDVADNGTALLLAERVPPVRLQVLDGTGYALWPTERRSVDTRYADVPAATLTVPTRASFVGMKLWAWGDRRAARDLYDLWSLATIGAVDADAVAAYEAAVGYRPPLSVFDRVPDAEEWRTALAHQTAVLPDVAGAVAAVRAALTAV